MNNSVLYFNRSMQWIRDHTINQNGIAVSSKENIIYPEVTGYYIPTLLEWGEKELAINYANYLCSIQKKEGSWYDQGNVAPYVFDSAQILKGLIAIRELLPEVDKHIIFGCDWILSNMLEDGHLTTPDMEAWGHDEDFCSELVHIYCLTPIRDAGIIFNRPDYLDAVDKILAYYKREKKDRIRDFSLLSHFYAYVMDGLYDLGEIELCRESMMRLEKYRNKDGGIPGLKDVSWICSTGLFQLAVVWYKLGDLNRGNSLFEYGLSLQNESGGWYGSYPAFSLLSRFYHGRNKPSYFPDAEISWAVKYFLDALALKEKMEFEKIAPIFLDQIDASDGRYVLVRKLIENASKSHGGKYKRLRICDVGCGKGRYLKLLSRDCPDNEYYAYDLSETVMRDIDFVKMKKAGSMTKIDYEDGLFDVVYACESYEHAINLEGAFKELYRITGIGGTLIIIDKPKEKQGVTELYSWEQWIDDSDIREYTLTCGGELEIVNSVPYEKKDDGLFRAWIIRKD